MEQEFESAVFSRPFVYRFGDCDDKKEASLYAVMKLLSEISGEGYERRGGLEHAALWEKGQVFLLSRLCLSFHRQPAYGEETIVSTWAREIKGPIFYRDYEIKSEKGELLVSGTSAWLVVNPVSREILRPASIDDLPVMDARKADCPEPKKLRKDPSLGTLGERPVYYSDIDSNGHMNNAVYGRTAVDFLPVEYRRKRIKDFFITFNIETRPDETLEIRGGKLEQGYALQGNVKGEMHFAAEFLFA